MENQEQQNDIIILNRKNKREEDFNKKLEKNQFKVMTSFKRIKNLYSDQIITKLKNYKREVGNSLKDLMGEENEENKKIAHKKLIELKNIKASKSLGNLSNISKRVELLSKKINFQIDKVKKSHENIAALNALYSDNNNTLPENKRNNSNGSNHRYNNDNNLVKSLDTSNFEEALRRKKLRKSFEILANKYHKGLSKAFISRFNPEQYLNNIKLLIHVSPTLRDDIAKTKKEVDGDVIDITDKNRYQKKYKRYMEKKAKSQSFQALDPQLYKSDEIIKKSVTAKNAEIADINKERRKSSIYLPNIGSERNLMNSNRDNRLKLGFIRKLQRRDSKKIMDMVDNQFDYMNRLQNISKEVDNFIGDENIKKNIESNLNDFKIYKYMNLFKDNDEKKNSPYKPKDYYYLQKSQINNLFGDLYINKLKSRVQDKERKLTDKLRINKDDYFSKMRSEMKNSLNDLDKNIIDNQIDMEETQTNDFNTPEK